MKKKGLFILLITVALLVVMILPAAAVTNGELDGDGHPHVVLLLMDVGGEPTYRCSATMLSPTVVLTAGHCTSNYPDAPYTGMRIYTESDVDAGDGFTNSYTVGTCELGNCYEAVSWSAHPLYEEGPWYAHDVGVVILKKPGVKKLDTYGELPELDELDVLATQRGLQDITFTSVGYGLQRIVSNPVWGPVHLQEDRVRMVAYPHLIQINVPGMVGDFSLLLSNNHSTGGTCFGDSGGPNFLGDSNVVAGVTSFGMNGNCAGTGGVFRMDRADVLDFVNGLLKPNKK